MAKGRVTKADLIWSATLVVLIFFAAWKGWM